MKDKEGVEIILRDLETNPSCQHGPTILFSSKNRKFFACSSNRSKECFYLEFEHFERNKEEILAANYKKIKQNSCEIGSNIDLRKVPASERYFCTTCNNFVIFSAISHKNHDTKKITDDILKEPSLFLPQLDDDKINAQYFFDDSTLKFIDSIFDELKLTSIICLGTPRLHDFLRNKTMKNTLLLDIDKRFKPFYPDAFCHFNMLNNFFFDGKKDEEKLAKFISSNDSNENASHCLFTDPPFAARTELLAETIRSISSLYFRVTRKLLPIFWIFPYFNENHIRQVMPQMEMMDFQVTYMNHHAFNSDYRGRKEGSVVRMFTNIQQGLIKYPAQLVDYRFCKPCDRFVSKNNLHCNICRICPSKNGSTYKHCNLCIKCVKPNYSHCQNCGRCTQKSGHECKIFQIHQECWMCHERGHVEKFCKFLMKIKRKSKNGRCRICDKAHNLSLCTEKHKFIK